MIQAILWAQWKSIRILRLGAGKSGALFSALTGILWYGFWGVVVVLLRSSFHLPTNGSAAKREPAKASAAQKYIPLRTAIIYHLLGQRISQTSARTGGVEQRAANEWPTFAGRWGSVERASIRGRSCTQEWA